MQDLLLGTLEISGLIVTLFFGSLLLSAEITQGTIFLLLSKKSNRGAVLLGKYFGFALVLLLLWALLSLSFVLIASLYHIPLLPVHGYVLGSIYLSRLLTLALVVFFSTFVSSFVALFCSLVIYLLGHTMGFVVYYVTVLKSDAFSSSFIRFMKGLYYIIPNYTALSFYEFLTVPFFGQQLASQFLGGAGVSIVFIVLLLTFGVVILRKKEL